MNDSVSLLDWGLFKMTLMLNEVEKKEGNEVFVDYLYDEDRIKVTGYRINDETLDSNAVHQVCDSWIKSIRIKAGLPPGRTKPFGQDYSKFAEMFSHTGYVNFGLEMTDKRLVELDKKFILEFLIVDSNYTARFRCGAPLAGEGFTTENLEKP